MDCRSAQSLDALPKPSSLATAGAMRGGCWNSFRMENWTPFWMMRLRI